MNNFNNFLRVLTLTMVQVFGDTSAILIGVSDDIEYGDDGKPTGRKLGVKYEVIADKMKYLPVTVKVPEAVPIITKEEIEAAGAEPVRVTFEGFAGRLYLMRGELGLTCKADKAMIVKEGGTSHVKGN